MVPRTNKYALGFRQKLSCSQAVGRLFQSGGLAAANARSRKRELVPIMVHLERPELTTTVGPVGGPRASNRLILPLQHRGTAAMLGCFISNTLVLRCHRIYDVIAPECTQGGPKSGSTDS